MQYFYLFLTLGDVRWNSIFYSHLFKQATFVTCILRLLIYILNTDNDLITHYMEPIKDALKTI
jgi:hypothetical protein